MKAVGVHHVLLVKETTIMVSGVSKGAAVWCVQGILRICVQGQITTKHKQLENRLELALRFSFRLFGISDGKGLLKRRTDFLTRFTDLR